MNKGYIAIISVIVLSVVLLVLAQVLATAGYFQGSGSNGFEAKERSYFTALSCVDRAIYNLAQDLDYAGNETIAIGDYRCALEPITLQATTTIIRATATTDGSTTKLKVTLDDFLNITAFTEE